MPEGRSSLAALQEALGQAYEIEQELGAGSVARVDLARDRTLGRLVALEVLRSGPASDETARLRFEREARAADALVHPNVLEVHHFGRLHLAPEQIQTGEATEFADIYAFGITGYEPLTWWGGLPRHHGCAAPGRPPGADPPPQDPAGGAGGGGSG